MYPGVRMQGSTGITKLPEGWCRDTMARNTGLRAEPSRQSWECLLRLPYACGTIDCHLGPPGRLSLECFSRCLGSPGHNHSLGFQDVYSLLSLGNISPPLPRTKRHLTSLLRSPPWNSPSTFRMWLPPSKKGAHQKPKKIKIK